MKIDEIKKQIREDAGDENVFVHVGLCEVGYDAQELLALCDSHSELVEACKTVARRDPEAPMILFLILYL